jgi:hypothetical protein
MQVTRLERCNPYRNTQFSYTFFAYSEFWILVAEIRKHDITHAYCASVTISNVHIKVATDCRRHKNVGVRYLVNIRFSHWLYQLIFLLTKRTSALQSNEYIFHDFILSFIFSTDSLFYRKRDCWENGIDQRALTLYCSLIRNAMYSLRDSMLTVS